MNILVITPIYYIEGRSNLFHDSSAVHTLLKPLAKENNIRVFHIYSQSLRHISRYISKKERRYYKNGYIYEKDDIKVFLCEFQRGYKQKAIFSDNQAKRAKRYLNDWLKKENFFPDLIVVHMPTTSLKLLTKICKNVNKVGILHMTDMLNAKNNNKIKIIDSVFRYTYARSAPIRDFFYNQSSKSIQKELILSGAPIDRIDRVLIDKPKIFKIIYVGKLIKRKNVDVIIKALYKLKMRHSFVLDIYGEGEQKNTLSALGKEMLDEKFNIHNTIPHSEVLRVMSESDIFIMTSVRETLGLVYLEAMSCGDIVIGSKGEGIDGIIVNGKNGYLVKPDSYDELAQCLDGIFTSSDEELNMIVSNAQNIVEELNEQLVSKKYFELVTRFPIQSKVMNKIDKNSLE